MSTSRLQHVIPATLILVLATIVVWLSFTQEPAEAYLFPRVVSIFFVALAVWNFIRAAAGMSKVGTGLVKQEVLHILPGFIVIAVFVFFAAKELGFYLSSTLAFFTIYSIYDPAPLSSLKDWGKRGAVTLIFMGVIYGLFYKLLQVQTPRGIWF